MYTLYVITKSSVTVQITESVKTDLTNGLKDAKGNSTHSKQSDWDYIQNNVSMSEWRCHVVTQMTLEIFFFFLSVKFFCFSLSAVESIMYQIGETTCQNPAVFLRNPLVKIINTGKR